MISCFCFCFPVELFYSPKQVPFLTKSFLLQGVMSLMAELVELTLGAHHIADMSRRVKYPSDTHVNTQHV